MIYRVTFSFSGGGEGWTETHLYRNANLTIDQLQPVMSQIAQFRANLLGSPFYVYSVRVANYYTEAGVRAPRGHRLWKGDNAAAFSGWYNDQFKVAKWASEPSNVALQAVGYAAAGAPAAFSGNSNQTFLGGAPDEVIDQNGAVFPASLNFAARYAVWAGAMTKPGAEWGWGAMVLLADLAMQGITQNLDGTVNFTVKGAIPPNIIVGSKYVARIRDVNNGRSVLNGAVIVVRNEDGSFTTREVIGMPTRQSGGAIKVYSQLPTFIPYGQLLLALRSVKHKRGKSPEAQRGRARTRIRG